MTVLIITLFSIILSFLLSQIFLKLRLCKLNYNNKPVPYSGGTIIIIGIVFSYLFYFLSGMVSSFKIFFFMISLFGIYAAGIVDDLFGDKNIKGIKSNIVSVFLLKFSTGIIKASVILAISCYIYFFFNEEYWLLKGILTALIANLFNLFDLRPGRCLKIYFNIWFLLSFASLRWTSELYIISFIVCISYYYFDAFGFSMLGDGGSNLIGFIAGLIVCESISGNAILLYTLIILLISIQLLLDRYSLTYFISKYAFIDYIDRFLTERQVKRDVKPGEGQSNKKPIF